MNFFLKTFAKLIFILPLYSNTLMAIKTMNHKSCFLYIPFEKKNNQSSYANEIHSIIGEALQNKGYKTINLSPAALSNTIKVDDLILSYATAKEGLSFIAAIKLGQVIERKKLESYKYEDGEEVYYDLKFATIKSKRNSSIFGTKVTLNGALASIPKCKVIA